MSNVILILPRLNLIPPQQYLVHGWRFLGHDEPRVYSIEQVRLLGVVYGAGVEAGVTRLQAPHHQVSGGQYLPGTRDKGETNRYSVVM